MVAGSPLPESNSFISPIQPRTSSEDSHVLLGMKPKQKIKTVPTLRTSIELLTLYPLCSTPIYPSGVWSRAKYAYPLNY